MSHFPLARACASAEDGYANELSNLALGSREVARLPFNVKSSPLSVSLHLELKFRSLVRCCRHMMCRHLLGWIRKGIPGCPSPPTSVRPFQALSVHGTKISYSYHFPRSDKTLPPRPFYPGGFNRPITASYCTKNLVRVSVSSSDWSYMKLPRFYSLSRLLVYSSQGLLGIESPQVVRPRQECDLKYCAPTTISPALMTNLENNMPVRSLIAGNLPVLPRWLRGPRRSFPLQTFPETTIRPRAHRSLHYDHMCVCVHRQFSRAWRLFLRLRLLIFADFSEICGPPVWRLAD